MEARPTVELSRERARRYLVGQLGLRRTRPEKGARGIRALLAALRCIQQDPLDRIGTNADLVALARVDGIRCGQVYDRLLPGHAFEHFAKERCLLPTSAFPYYRERMAGRDGWRYGKRLRRPTRKLQGEVLEEIREGGPILASALADRGRARALDWPLPSPPPPLASLALEMLVSRCQVVVCGRTGAGKLYDLPERALPRVFDAPPAADFDRWALLERVEAAGLLCLATGPHWSMLEEVRTGGLPAALVDEGLLEVATIEGSRRSYLAPAGFRKRRFPRDDGRMRILGPLDPLLWDRKLVAQVFGFDYVWEVYKPAARRKWGYYVCPLLHRGGLVGRFEGRRTPEGLRVENLWREEGAAFDERAWRATLARHEAAL